MLAVFAISLAVAGGASLFVPLTGVWAVSGHAAMVFSFFDGRARVFWITSEQLRIEVNGIQDGKGLRVTPVAGPEDDWSDVVRQPSPGRGGRGGQQISLAPRGAVPAFGGQWRGRLPLVPTLAMGGAHGVAASGPVAELSYVRMPVWLPTVLLLLQPIRAIIFGPWLWRRRERRNLCLACGYERMGLTEPRCPECGTPHVP